MLQDLPTANTELDYLNVEQAISSATESADTSQVRGVVNYVIANRPNVKNLSACGV